MYYCATEFGMSCSGCKMFILSVLHRLERNDLTHRCCEVLAIIVSSNRMLRNLSLRDNHLGDKGMCLLSTTLKNTECRIQRLKYVKYFACVIPNVSKHSKCTPNFQGSFLLYKPQAEVPPYSFLTHCLNLSAPVNLFAI